MDKKILLWVLMFFIIINVAEALITLNCTQPGANASVSCGGIPNGTYANFSGASAKNQQHWLLWDNNLSTFANGSATQEILININYTKPASANQNLSRWLIYGSGIANLSIPNNCWSTFPSKIGFLLRSAAGGGQANWYCINGSNPSVNKVILKTLGAGGTVDGKLFEEEMNWVQNFSVRLDNCSLYTNETITFSIRNISDNSSISNPNMDFYFNYDSDGEGKTLNYSTSTNSSNITFCLSNTQFPAVSDITVDYSYGGLSYEYSTDNINLTNVTQSIILYTQDATDRVTFTVTDLFDDPLESALVKILLYDVGTNTYRTTEVVETNNDGEAIGNVVLYTEWYKFIVVYAGVTYIVTEPIKVFETTKTFRIDITGEDWFGNFDTTQGVGTELNFTNSTRNFRYTWNDPSGAMHKGCLKVEYFNATGTHTICDSCTESTAATILCSIGTDNDGISYTAVGYLQYDLEYITDVLNIKFPALVSRYLFDKGAEAKEFGVFLTWFVMVALTFVGLWSIPIAILLNVMSFVVSSQLGFIDIKPPMLVTFILLGLIAMYKIGKK